MVCFLSTLRRLSAVPLFPFLLLLLDFPVGRLYLVRLFFEVVVYGEIRVGGVLVRLHAPDDSVLATTTTAPDGSYLFAPLAPGLYYVSFVAPAGFGFTEPDTGPNDAVDSDADTAGRTILTVLDANGVVLDLNEHFISIYTFDPLAAHGKHYRELIWPYLLDDDSRRGPAPGRSRAA